MDIKCIRDRNLLGYVTHFIAKVRKAASSLPKPRYTGEDEAPIGLALAGV